MTLYVVCRAALPRWRHCCRVCVTPSDTHLYHAHSYVVNVVIVRRASLISRFVPGISEKILIRNNTCPRAYCLIQLSYRIYYPFLFLSLQTWRVSEKSVGFSLFSVYPHTWERGRGLPLLFCLISSILSFRRTNCYKGGVYVWLNRLLIFFILKAFGIFKHKKKFFENFNCGKNHCCCRGMSKIFDNAVKIIILIINVIHGKACLFETVCFHWTGLAHFLTDKIVLRPSVRKKCAIIEFHKLIFYLLF